MLLYKLLLQILHPKPFEIKYQRYLIFSFLKLDKISLLLKYDKISLMYKRNFVLTDHFCNNAKKKKAR